MVEGQEVRAGAAIRDADHIDPVLVDVVGPLQFIQNAQQVLQLVLMPPHGAPPGGGIERDPLGRMEAVEVPFPVERVVFGVHAAVQKNPEWGRAGGVIGGGYGQRVVVPRAIGGTVLETEAAAGNIRRIRSSLAQPLENRVEGGLFRFHLLNGALHVRRIRRLPEPGQRPVQAALALEPGRLEQGPAQNGGGEEETANGRHVSICGEKAGSGKL